MALPDSVRPRLRHARAEVRAAAVRRLKADEIDVLRQVALEDRDPRIRRLAIEKLRDTDLLLELASQEQDEDLRRFIRDRVDKLRSADATGAVTESDLVREPRPQILTQRPGMPGDPDEWGAVRPREARAAGPLYRLEVSCPDRPGVLLSLHQLLHDLDLDILSVTCSPGFVAIRADIIVKGQEPELAGALMTSLKGRLQTIDGVDVRTIKQVASGQVSPRRDGALRRSDLADELLAAKFVRQRHRELVDRKHAHGLQPTEQEELARLGELLDEMDAPYYQDTLRQLRALVAQTEGSAESGDNAAL